MKKKFLCYVFIFCACMLVAGQQPAEKLTIIQQAANDPELSKKYTIPSFTGYRRAAFRYNKTQSPADSLRLLEAIHALQPAVLPYNVNMTVHGDPQQQLGFTWYTNQGIQAGDFTHHFHTQAVAFDQALSTSPGAVYSFVYGNALFVVASTEDYKVEGYLDSLKLYIRQEVKAHPDVNWKIMVSHKAIYTGAAHQDDTDARIVRQALAPLYDELGIDLVIQGHDHVYEVIGPVKNYTLVEQAVSQVREVPADPDKNATGREGGVFDVSDGTLYFLNNSAGKKKYYPLSKKDMDAQLKYTAVEDYWNLFSGKLGQTGEPTFSDVQVTADTLFITTYTVDDNGTPSVFDAFKLTKARPSIFSRIEETSIQEKGLRIYPNPARDVVILEGSKLIRAAFYNSLGQWVEEARHKNNTIDTSRLPQGLFYLRMETESGVTVKPLYSVAK